MCFAQRLVILTLLLPLGAWWNYCRLAVRLQRLKHALIGIIALIDQHRVNHYAG